MASAEDRDAARELARLATSHVGPASGREPARAALRRVARGRLGTRHGWPVVPVLGTSWQGTISPERAGWHHRAAYPDGKVVFAVHYQVCRRCVPLWIEQSYTVEQYQRCGLASAGAAEAAIRGQAAKGAVRFGLREFRSGSS